MSAQEGEDMEAMVAESKTVVVIVFTEAWM